jgi:hypothetical protein
VALSSWDDFPVHQAPEFIAHPGTSDRNFYDRYYFNMYPIDAEWSAIFGFGQYPNLGVVDAFVDVRLGEAQHIVRASTPLKDRADLSVGPFHVEVLEPLRRLRFVVDETEHDVAMDVTWEGHIPAMEEPRQYLRSQGRVVFDTQRLAQTGFWSGTLSVAGTEYAVTADQHHGCRDRSWGIRPVGEPEGDGIRQGANVMAGMWNYFPMQFDDHAILYICHERDNGDRPLVQGERVWVDPDRPVEELGRAEHAHHLIPGTRVMDAGLVRFPEADLEITCTPLLETRHVPGSRHSCAGARAPGRGDEGPWSVRHRGPRGPVQLRRRRRVRAARARLLRAVPSLRDDRRSDGRSSWLTLRPVVSLAAEISRLSRRFPP